MIPADRQRCRVRVRGIDGGYHDCRRRDTVDDKGKAIPHIHGNPVYGDFLPGHPVVKKRIGAAASSNYEMVGVIDTDGKVKRTD